MNLKAEEEAPEVVVVGVVVVVVVVAVVVEAAVAVGVVVVGEVAVVGEEVAVVGEELEAEAMEEVATMEAALVTALAKKEVYGSLKAVEERKYFTVILQYLMAMDII